MRWTVNIRLACVQLHRKQLVLLLDQLSLQYDFEHVVGVILCKCVKVVNGHDIYTSLWVIFLLIALKYS